MAGLLNLLDELHYKNKYARAKLISKVSDNDSQSNVVQSRSPQQRCIRLNGESP